MVDDLAKLDVLLTTVEKEQSPRLKFEFTIELVDLYFNDFFYVTNVHQVDILIEQSLKYYTTLNLKDDELEIKFLLFQAAIKFNKFDFERTSKNLRRCKQLMQIFDANIYHAHYHIKVGILLHAKKKYQKALSEFKKALSIIEEMENGFKRHAKLYLDVYGSIFVCYFQLGDYELAFSTYYQTIKLGKKHQIYEPLAKINVNFYSYCFFAGAHREAKEAFALTKHICKKTNSKIVRLFSIIIEINKKYYEDKYDEFENLLEKYKNTLLNSKMAYFSCFFLRHKIDIKLFKKEYAIAFEYLTQLAERIKSVDNPYNYYFLLTTCEVCILDKKYLNIISEMPEYQKYKIDHKLENLFIVCIKYVDKQPKRDKIILYNLIIQHYKKNGFSESGLEILTDCINELQKIGNESIKTEMIHFKQKYEATEKIKSTVELLEKQEKLTQFFKEFAYTAAHDLKSPLITITEFARIIKNSYNDLPDKNAHEYLNIILETSQTMSKFINELIIHKGNDKEGLTKIYLEDIVNQVKINLYKDIENSSCTIQVLSKDVSFIGRRTPLKILFQNLISNAIKYKKKGVEPVVKINITKDTKKIISVSDNGIGVPKKLQKKIFDPFFQIPNKKIVGSGIGLATCKRIVESFGGRIWIESIVNKGTTFYFTFSK